MDDFDQQLKGLFNRCSDCVDGRLGIEGLQELCQRLDISHQYGQLVEDLHINENKSVTFKEFKDALMRLLGVAEAQCHESSSSAREVSPKYAFGKKKYGRRSRPHMSVCESNLVDGVEACSVTEQSAIKKRKTDEESFENSLVLGEGSENEEEMLVAAWATVAAAGGTLTRDQLVRVFQAVGLQEGSEEAAASVFEKLELSDEGITLEALLAFVRGGAPLCKEKTHDFSDSSPSVDYIDSSSGTILGQNLLELLEANGVVEAQDLLHALGCRLSHQCDLSVMTTRLNNLVQCATEDRSTPLLRAGLVLQRVYIQSLKTLVEQISGEKEKLKADVSEANERAQLLAQEVDDHHTRMEAATLRRVKALEQRHSDRVRELTEQVKLEQEQLTQQNILLERRVTQLELEESRTKAELTKANGENSHLQEEHRNALELLNNLQKERDALLKNVQELDAVQLKLQDLEEGMRDRDVAALLERLSGLEGENRTLRDRNDELSLQIEDLTSRLQNSSLNKRVSPSTSLNLTVDAAMRDVSAMPVPNGAISKSFSDVECDEMDGEIDDRTTQGTQLCGFSFKSAFKLKSPAVDESIVREGEMGDDARCNCSSTVASLQGDLSKLKDEDSKLKKRCHELEESMQLLQDEYEKTEDYWTSKLEEERNLFDAEQRQSDEKYCELVNKILEYEQLIKEEAGVKQRLEPIEEKDGLEKQVQEIEEEYSRLLSAKNAEIDRLMGELNSHPPVSDALAQTDFSPSPSDSNSQHSHCRRSLTFSSGDRRRHCCKVYRLQGEIRSLLEAKQAAQGEISALLAERDLLYKQVMSRRREVSCSANLNGKLLCAERRCRTLMSSLRNQQLQTAELLRKTWQQHKREVEELRSVIAHADGKLQQQTSQIQLQLNKLAAADHLAKDLFIENSYLFASLRKLEAQQLRQSLINA